MKKLNQFKNCNLNIKFIKINQLKRNNIQNNLKKKINQLIN